MTEWIVQVIRSTGYLGLVLLMFAENIFPPIPSEVIMPLAGFLVSKGQLHIVGVILSGTLGSLLGAFALYYLGYKMEPERLKGWCQRYGRWFVITTRDVDRAQRWFDRYGIWTVLLARLIPGIRSLISIPAGFSRMSLIPFVIFTALGTAAWSALLAYAGMLLGQQFEQTQRYIGPVSTGVIALLALWYLHRVIFPPGEDHKNQKD